MADMLWSMFMADMLGLTQIENMNVQVELSVGLADTLAWAVASYWNDDGQWLHWASTLDLSDWT